MPTEVEDPELEDIRGWYIDGRRVHNPFASDVELVGRFDRWLADHDARVKAEAAAQALEEAAEAEADWTSIAWRPTEAETVVKLRKALKRRAAEYRKGQADGTD